MSSSKSKLAVGVSVLLVSEDGLVLMSERLSGVSHAQGMISTPGGRIEENETRFECAEREFAEECGGATLNGPLIDLGYKEHFRFDMHYFMCYIKATSYSGEIKNAEPDKHKDWTWMNPFTLKPGTCTEPEDILLKLKKTDIQKNIEHLQRKLIASDLVLLDQVTRHIKEIEQLSESRLNVILKMQDKEGELTSRCIK